LICTCVFPSGFPTKICYVFHISPCMLHDPPISHILIWWLACLPLDIRFAGSNLAKGDGFLRVIKICSMLTFQGKVKLPAPHHKILQHVKNSCVVDQKMVAVYGMHSTLPIHNSSQHIVIESNTNSHTNENSKIQWPHAGLLEDTHLLTAKSFYSIRALFVLLNSTQIYHKLNETYLTHTSSDLWNYKTKCLQKYYWNPLPT
jgi:hypothetical protein